jgi:hypothetical protein
MKTWNIQIDEDADLLKAEDNIDKCCRNFGLVETMKTTLRSYPGSIHWHYKKREKESMLKGSLEITFWKPEGKIWLSVHSGREDAWIDEIIYPLKEAIESSLKSKVRLGEKRRTYKRRK